MAEEVPGDRPDERPGRFAPVVLVGLASSALTAVASAKAWIELPVDFKAVPGLSEQDAGADMPLALALALVMLAAWGVVLVSRTRGRRVALTLAAAAAVGVLGCLISAPLTLPDQLREQLGPDGAGLSAHPTRWYAAAALGAVLAAVAIVAGWILAPRWPSMSSRYDAPAGGAGPVDDTDLWKALDAGLDPTDAPERSDP